MVALYLDSADREVVVPLVRTGLFAGVTTNPAILQKSGLGTADVPEVISWAMDAGAARVFAQVSGSSTAELVARGEQWRALSERVVVKVAYSPHGVVAARELAQSGEVLVTALHRADQILPVIAAQATFVAAFVARMDAVGRPGIKSAIEMQQAVTASGAEVRVMAGSLRTPDQLLALAQGGVRHMTIAPTIWQSLFDDDVTRAAVENFEVISGHAAAAAS